MTIPRMQFHTQWHKVVVIKQVLGYSIGMSTLVDTIKKAITASGKTRYRIAKDTGVTQGQLSRLMTGECGLSVESVEILAEYLGLEITIKPKRRQKGR